jgi:hypothetical protein
MFPVGRRHKDFRYSPLSPGIKADFRALPTVTQGVLFQKTKKNEINVGNLVDIVKVWS